MSVRNRAAAWNRACRCAGWVQFIPLGQSGSPGPTIGEGEERYGGGCPDPQGRKLQWRSVRSIPWNGWTRENF